jgi:hypothetical protein
MAHARIVAQQGHVWQGHVWNTVLAIILWLVWFYG